MKKLFYSMLIISMAIVLLIPTIVLACHMDVCVSINTHWTRSFDWTIDKSVDIDNWDFVPGDSGTSKYTITVTKDDGTDSAWVDGVITVTNYLGENVGITITANLYKVGLASPIATVDVDVSGNNYLIKNETGTYNYSITIPEAYVDPAYSYKVKATVTPDPNNYGIFSDFSTNACLPAPTLINNSINVDDTYNNGTWAFSDSDSVQYDRIFSCEDEGTNVNTATIRETQQSDEATVVVVCTPTTTPPTTEITITTAEITEVGGTIYPTNKGWMLAPAIALVVAILTGTVILIRRRQNEI